MTRRIALAILFTVWLMLVAVGALAYVTTRQVLLEDLDATLMNRALSLPELAGVNSSPTVSPDANDRFIVKNDVGRTIARPATASAVPPPVLISAAFSTVAQGRVRTLSLRAYAKPIALGAPPSPVTITYTGSAEQFDHLLNHLAWSLGIAGIVGGIAAAAVARWVSRTALRPLNDTAQTIGAIDEHHLDRRIDVQSLPVELHPMADRLNEMLLRLEDAFQQRTRFLGDASHELRTPVAALVTTMQISLRQQRDAAAYRQTLELCLAEAQHMRSLVEKLMEHVRGETDQHAEPPADVDLAALLNRCVETVLPLATGKNVAIARSIAAIGSFRTQPGRIRSIIVNLLSNAIEYNRPGGSIEITCKQADGRIQLTISDTGVGIAAKHLPHLFEPFYRVDSSRTASGHLGLGLFLVQSHVRALGGQIRVQSTVDVGTTFTLDLPLIKDQPQQQPHPGNSVAEGAK